MNRKRSCLILETVSATNFKITRTFWISREVINDLIKLRITNKYKANVTIDEIGVPITENDLVLPCGMTGRVEFYE